MPAEFLIDISELDLSQVVIDPAEIYRLLPHRHEMALLDGIVHYAPDDGFAIGYKDVRDDEFWCRGHIPGFPLLPGVLMVEAAGQLCGYYFDREMKKEGKNFFGFAGLDTARFRGTVRPGQRLYIVAKMKRMRTHSGMFFAQGLVDGEIAFDVTIKGMTIPKDGMAGMGAVEE